MDLIERIKQGEENAIQEGMFHKGAFVRANALVYAARNNCTNATIVYKAKDMENDDVCLFGHNDGYKVSDFAKAYLHIMKIKNYSGSRKEILNLINSDLQF